MVPFRVVFPPHSTAIFLILHWGFYGAPALVITSTVCVDTGASYVALALHARAAGTRENWMRCVQHARCRNRTAASHLISFILVVKDSCARPRFLRPMPSTIQYLFKSSFLFLKCCNNYFRAVIVYIVYRLLHVMIKLV